MQRVLAMTSDGRLTYCSCDPSQRGKGRCNHIFHKNEDETEEDFTNRAEFLSSKKQSFDLSKELTAYEDGFIDGALSKFYDEESDSFYKLDSESEMFEQRNALSEEMACLIEGSIEGFDYCEYETLCVESEGVYKIACKSKNFLPKDKELKSINRVLNLKDPDSFLVDGDFDEDLTEARQKQLDFVADKVSVSTGITKEEIKRKILEQISLDFLIMNNDRTLNNMALITDKNGGSASFSPCFDNGSCIQAYKEFDDFSIEEIDEEFNICTFGIGRNEDYINLIRNNGGPFLKIRKEELIKKIKKYECKAYPKNIVERNKKIFIRNLKKYKGILYEEV